MNEHLADLEGSIRQCVQCAARFEDTKTAHHPNPILQISNAARLCIAGQAPGLRAHGTGQPFTDASGDRLRGWMGIGADIFYDREKLAIAPMAFCFPGYNANNHDLPPPPICAQMWRQPLFDALPQLELIITVGKAAAGWHLPALRSKRLTDTVRLGMIEGSPPVLPLPHPSWRNNAWLKGNPWFESDILPLLRAEVSRLTA